MFQSRGNNKLIREGDDSVSDDFFPVTSHSSGKLASLFSDDSSRKFSKNLHYVAPKQPAKEEEAHLDSSSAERAGKLGLSSEILFASAAELFSYYNNEPKNEGVVMCCIIAKKEMFIVLVYKSESNIISQAKIHNYFRLIVQKNNYVTFTDNSSCTWSLLFDSSKYEEFLVQIGICRALSTFQETASPMIVTQLLSQGDEDAILKRGDSALITYSCCLVENYKKGQMIEETKTRVRVCIDNDASWQAGLLNCSKSQRCLVFTQTKSNDNRLSVVVYDVFIESLGKEERPTDEPRPFVKSTSDLQEESEAMKKASLISRMAKVGQPLLPTTPRFFSSPSIARADSESEMEDHQSVEDHMKANHVGSSLSNSLEEIDNTSNRTYPYAKYMTAANDHPRIQDTTHLSGYGQRVFVPPELSTVVPFQRCHHREESSNKTSDSILSMLFTESRSQNTETRMSLTQLTQKVDLMYNKLNNLETTLNSSTAPFCSDMNRRVLGSQFNPQELLSQITLLVEQVQVSKQEAKEAERHNQELTRDYAEILKKNQKLLEEKAELLALREEHVENKTENKFYIEQLQSIQKEKFRLESELLLASGEMQELQKDLEILKSAHTDLINENKALKNTRLKQAAILDTIQSQKNHLKTDVSTLKKNVKDVVEMMMTEIDKLNTLLTQISKNDSHAKEKIIKLEAEKTELEGRVDSLSQREAVLQERIKEFEATTPSNSRNETSAEVLIKQIMNVAYKKLKRDFKESETYTKEIILQNVLVAIRETTLHYLQNNNNSDPSQTNNNSDPSRGTNAPKPSVDLGQPKFEQISEMSDSSNVSFAPLGPEHRTEAEMKNRDPPTVENPEVNALTDPNHQSQTSEHRTQVEIQKRVPPTVENPEVNALTDPNHQSQTLSSSPSLSEHHNQEPFKPIVQSLESDGEALPTPACDTSTLSSTKKTSGNGENNDIQEQEDPSTILPSSSCDVTAAVSSVGISVSSVDVTEQGYSTDRLNNSGAATQKPRRVDNEAWRPPSPPPPLFSDSESDDDWFS